MKTVTFLIIALFTQLAFGNAWKQQNHNLKGYSVRLSYTTAMSPATYGSQGGNHEGIFYVDLYSKNNAFAESVEIFEISNSGRLDRISSFRFTEDNSKHFYAQKPQARTYNEFIWFGKMYKIRIIVDGQILETSFRL